MRAKKAGWLQSKDKCLPRDTSTIADRIAKELLAGRLTARDLQIEVQRFRDGHDSWLHGFFDRIDQFETRLALIEVLVEVKRKTRKPFPDENG